MRAAKHTRRRPLRGISGTLLTTGLLTAALIATTLLATSAAAPAALTRVTTVQVTSPATGTSAAAHRARHPAKVPGWRVVKTIGPAAGQVSGLLTAASADDAWSVWSGPGIARVEHWTGGEWARVPVPARLDTFVRSAVSIGASPAGGVWLFGADPTPGALRFTGGKWRLAALPSWVLRHSTTALSASAAVFGPADIWVFSLNDGAYAAHYNGRSWVKVRLPGVPYDVSFAGPDSIWALGPATAVMHWNGTKWSTVRLPPPHLPTHAFASYASLTAAGQRGAWLFRSIFLPSRKLPVTTMLHWNGSAWHAVASPADIVGSLAPDGDGGLWANGIDINPGGFWFLYHYTGGKWSAPVTPPGVDIHSQTALTLIPGTRSLWAVGSADGPQGSAGVILRYGP